MCEKIDDTIFAQSEKMLNKELMALTYDVVNKYYQLLFYVRTFCEKLIHCFIKGHWSP